MNKTFIAVAAEQEKALIAIRKLAQDGLNDPFFQRQALEGILLETEETLG